MKGLRVETYLGEQHRDMSDYGRPEVAHRRFYHLTCSGNPLKTWRHYERHPSEGDGPIAFDFFWALLPDGLPPLVADQGYLVPCLLEVL